MSLDGKMPKKPVCIKCGQASGDDWTQCIGGCPMPMSPHYDKAEEAKNYTAINQQTTRVYLNLSTANITQETAEYLERCARDHLRGFKSSGIFAINHGYGFYVFADEGAEGMEDMTDDLLACIQLARRFGYEWIDFDRDHDPHPDLSSFEW